MTDQVRFHQSPHRMISNYMFIKASNILNACKIFLSRVCLNWYLSLPLSGIYSVCAVCNQLHNLSSGDCVYIYFRYHLYIHYHYHLYNLYQWHIRRYLWFIWYISTMPSELKPLTYLENGCGSKRVALRYIFLFTIKISVGITKSRSL